MVDSPHLTLFLVAALVLSVTPGPAVLFIVARGIQSGRATALRAALGVAIGSLGRFLSRHPRVQTTA